jgi:hypothetical protein
VLDGVGATAYLALVARSPMIRPRLIRSLIIKALLSGLRFGVFVIHNLDSIEVASPVPLSRVRAGGVLPRPIMVPLKSVSSSLWGRPEVSLITIRRVGYTLLRYLDHVGAILLFLRGFGLKLLLLTVWRIAIIVKSKRLHWELVTRIELIIIIHSRINKSAHLVVNPVPVRRLTQHLLTHHGRPLTLEVVLLLQLLHRNIIIVLQPLKLLLRLDHLVVQWRAA